MFMCDAPRLLEPAPIQACWGMMVLGDLDEYSGVLLNKFCKDVDYPELSRSSLSGPPRCPVTFSSNSISKDSPSSHIFL